MNVFDAKVKLWPSQIQNRFSIVRGWRKDPQTSSIYLTCFLLLFKHQLTVNQFSCDLRDWIIPHVVHVKPEQTHSLEQPR